MRTPAQWMTIGALALTLAACSASGGDASSSETGQEERDQAASDSGGFAGDEAEVAPEAPAEGADTNSAPFGDGLDLADGDRSVITNGAVTLSTEDPVAAADEITRLAESMGGWVEGMTLQAGSDTVDPSAHVVTRIPSSDVSTALGKLRDIGEVESVQLDRTDVTLEVRDLEARIRAVQMSVERMQALLARAATVDELVQAEQMLTDRQSQLEQLLSQQAGLEDQVSMSTLTIDVVVPEEVPEVVEPEEPKEGFLGGLENGWNAFLDFGSGALLVLGALLPWLVFAAALAVIALGLRRAWVKMRPERPVRAARGAPAPLATAPTPGAWAGAAPVPAAPVPAAPVPAMPAPPVPVPAPDAPAPGEAKGEPSA